MKNKIIKMNTLFVLPIFCLFLISCGSNSNDSNQNKEQGANLLDESDIQTCHQNVNKKSAVKQRIAGQIKDVIQQKNAPFDWNNVGDDMFCDSFSLGDGIVTIGTTMTNTLIDNIGNITRLQAQIREHLPPPVIFHSRNNKLSLITLFLQSCAQLTTIRELPLVEFVELPYNSELDPVFQDSQRNAKSVQSCDDTVETDNPSENEEEQEGGVEDTEDEGIGEFNPGLYDPDDNHLRYDQYMNHIDTGVAGRMRRHNLDKVYDTYRYFGSDKIGIAVLDNGVLPERVTYLSTGSSSFKIAGYFSAPFDSDSEFDGPHPMPYDVYGLPLLIPPLKSHGTDQSVNVFAMAPQSNRLSVRAANFMLLLHPNHTEGVTKAIIAVADNPDIRIISMSMGNVFYSHQIKRAIDYFNNKGKIFVAAAGTSIKGVRDLVKIVFPARLPSTISITGILDTEENNGEFILGSEAHGGPQNDFVIDYADASSPATSSAAGMIAVLWSVNPSLSRSEIFEILKKSSTYYRQQREKHPLFGWGKFDMLLAVERAMETLSPKQ